MSEITDFIAARLDEDEAHAKKDLWCADRATEGWEAHPGYNLPYSDLHAGGQVIARFTGTRGAGGARQLRDGSACSYCRATVTGVRCGNCGAPWLA